MEMINIAFLFNWFVKKNRVYKKFRCDPDDFAIVIDGPCDIWDEGIKKELIGKVVKVKKIINADVWEIYGILPLQRLPFDVYAIPDHLLWPLKKLDNGEEFILS